MFQSVFIFNKRMILLPNGIPINIQCYACDCAPACVECQRDLYSSSHQLHQMVAATSAAVTTAMLEAKIEALDLASSPLPLVVVTTSFWLLAQ